MVAKARRKSLLPFDGKRHDHGLCIDKALNEAERLCQRRGVRLTALRKRVLALVWTSHSPVGAYDVLARLSEDHGRTAPPTVYRALEFLLEQGLVHRIESLNAFVGCPDPGASHSGQFLICRDCGAAAEMDVQAIDKAIAAQAAACGFAVEGKTVEVRGLCPACKTAAAKL